MAPLISGMSANLTVQYAVGLHTYSGWAGSGAVGTTSNPILGRYALLNEDAGTSITTNGNISVGGNISLGNGIMVSYRDKIQSLGTTSGSITLDGTVAPSWSITLNGGLTLGTSTFTNYATGSSVTLIITQDGTGNRQLTSTGIKWAGGNNTLSVPAGSVDIANFYYDGSTWYGSLVKGYV